jgi:hypothetical protein
MARIFLGRERIVKRRVRRPFAAIIPASFLQMLLFPQNGAVLKSSSSGFVFCIGTPVALVVRSSSLHAKTPEQFTVS